MLDENKQLFSSAPTKITYFRRFVQGRRKYTGYLRGPLGPTKIQQPFSWASLADENTAAIFVGLFGRRKYNSHFRGPLWPMKIQQLAIVFSSASEQADEN
jgi:hypothetical protein